MLKLKQSGFVKALCFTLSAICLMLAYADVLLIPELIDNDIYNVSKEDFTDILNQDAVNNLAWKAVNCFEDSLNIEGDIQTVKYKSYMAEERSNAACEITDGKGIVLYKTFTPDKNNCFAYKTTHSLFLNAEQAVAFYKTAKKAGSDLTLSESGDFKDSSIIPMPEYSTDNYFHNPETDYFEAANQPTEPSSIEYEYDITDSNKDNGLYVDEPTFYEDSSEEISSELSLEEINQNIISFHNFVYFNGELYYVSYLTAEEMAPKKNNSNDFIYLYPVTGANFTGENSQPNTLIRDYCISCVTEKLYRKGNVYGTLSGHSFVFFENNYTLDSAGNVFPKENPEVNFTEKDILQPFTGGYYPVEVNVYLSKNIDRNKKDFFTYIDIISSLAYSYTVSIVPLTVIFAVLGLALFIFTLVLCGYKKGTETPVATGWHKIPFDIALAIYAASVGFAVYAAMEENLFPLPLAVTGFITLFAVESFTVRIKAHTVISSLIGIKILKAICKSTKKTAGKIKYIFRSLSDNISLVWKLGIAYGIYFVISFFTLAFDIDGHMELFILWLISSLVLLALTVFAALGLTEIQNGAKNISEGKLNHRIKMNFLFGEFRKNAEYLNSIGDAVDKAITEQMQSERLKTELITNVSHDLKTPLTSIVNYVDLLKKEEIDNPKAAEYIEVIDRQSQRLKKLTFDVVDASKAATGNIQVNLEKCDLGMLIAQVNGEYTDKLTLAKLQTVVELPEKQINITTDGRLLWRVFDNLMGNICKYSQPNTRVYITLTQYDKKAKVVFKNISATKLNISPNELTERFVRGDESRNTEGSGLGLSIANSLINAMNGQLTLDIDGDLFKATVEFDCE